MAIITNEGIFSTTLTEFKNSLETAFQLSIAGDLDIGSQTPAGQIIGILSLAFVVVDNQTVLEFQQLNIYAATGQQLDAFGATFEISRESETKSIIIATLTGVSGTIIPADSQAKNTDNKIFLLENDATLDLSGQAVANFIAEESGPIPIDAGTLTQIVTVIPGWETLSNSGQGEVGQDKESDLNYRNRYFQTLGKNALSTIEAIRSAILDIDDVVSAQVFDNDTAQNKIIQNVELLPHSIACVVEGSDTENTPEIGAEIERTKTVGAATAGANTGIQTAVDVPTNGGLGTTIVYFYPVEFITVTIAVEIDLYDNTPDVTAQITTNLINYFNGTFSPDIPEIGIADASYRSRLYKPVLAVQGFDVTLLEQSLSPNPPEEIITPDLNQRLIVTEDSITVTITP
jgi:uncharacterized phage protein gp47/JayE